MPDASNQRNFGSGICMSSMSDRQPGNREGLQLPGVIQQLSPVEQLPFPDSPLVPGNVTRRLGPDSSPGVSDTQTGPQPISTPGETRPLQLMPLSPHTTRVLTDLRQTGALSNPQTTTALRQPVVIPGTGKKSAGLKRPPKGRRWVVHLAVTMLLVVITLLTALTVIPLTTGSGHGLGPLGIFSNPLFHSDDNGLSLSAQATATAVITHQDGYDNSGTTYGGNPAPGGVTPDHFAFGQCTYWADMRYHQLTGYWVNWFGNAWQWKYGAAAAGWIVSTTPHVPSIIVLQPFVQGAGAYGHVAVVEKINPDGSVYTSNYNWYANGGWDRLSYWTFNPGPGVTFIWHP